jgi:PAS domain S-box-containing protein
VEHAPVFANLDRGFWNSTEPCVFVGAPERPGSEWGVRMRLDLLTAHRLFRRRAAILSSGFRFPGDVRVTGPAREVLDMYRMAALQTADHWMITDIEGTIVEVNPAFESVTGYARNDVIGRKPNVIKSGVHDGAFYEHMWKTLESGLPYRGIVVNRRKNGDLFHEMKTITPVKDSSGKTTYYFSIGKDISELKAAESELRNAASELERANQRLVASEASLLRHISILESVLGSMNEGVIVADADGRFVMFNPAAERMVGIGSTDAEPAQWTTRYGIYLPDRTTPCPTDDLPLVRAINGETTDDVEVFIRNPSKKEGAWLSIRGNPLRDKDGATIGGLIVTRDVTHDKWAEGVEKELTETRAEMQIAERIQHHFFPTEAPAVDGTEIAGASRAAVVTGGDYYDYVWMPDGGVLLVVADVSGHGFGPALLMASVRAYVRSLAESGVDARNILSIVNRLIWADTDVGDFVTLAIVRLDPVSRTCTYASAGHTTGYLFDGSGRVKREMESAVPPLGVVPEVGSFDLSEIELCEGDLLLMLTDGIIEAEDSAGVPFGVRRTLNTVRGNRHRPACEIVDALHKAAAEHCAGKLQDDITSIVVKVLPGSSNGSGSL